MGSSRWDTGRAEGCEMGLCPRVQSDGPSGMSRTFQVGTFCLQLHVILVFFPLGESRGVPDLVAFAQ